MTSPEDTTVSSWLSAPAMKLEVAPSIANICQLYRVSLSSPAKFSLTGAAAFSLPVPFTHHHRIASSSRPFLAARTSSPAFSACDTAFTRSFPRRLSILKAL